MNYDVEKIASRLGIPNYCYHYDTNSVSVISLDIYNPEYDNLHPSEKENIIQFAASFKFLKILNISISDFVIKDLSSFSDLIYLESLYLESDTEIADLSFLKSMKLLESLHIQSSKITEITELENLNHLNLLQIRESNIENIDAIEDLKSLEFLDFSFNNIKDLSPLKDLKFLKSIDFSNNNVEDISVLSEFENLEYLNISSNSVSDISFIAKNFNLKTLVVSENKIRNIEVISNFSYLYHLSINDNEINDFEVLENLKELNYLNVSETKISSLKILNSNVNLKYLLSDNNLIADFSEFQMNSQLHFLSLNHCGIKNLDFIKNQKEIRILYLNDNQIEELSPLQNLDFLTEIYLKNNRIKDTFPIHYFSQLSFLDLSGNRFGNKKFLKYVGFDDQKEDGESVGLLEDLKKINADYYFEIGDNDAALAFYYYDHRTKFVEEFYIYLEKFLNTPSHETVYIKYYFSKIFGFLFEDGNFSKIQPEDFDKLERKVSTVKQPEKNKMLVVLDNLKIGLRAFYHFNYLDFYFYEKNVANPLIDDELLFLKGSVIVNRENLMTNIYFLKLLKQRNSPFYFNLFHKIKNILDMNFAYNKEERLQHDDYMDLLHHLDDPRIIKRDDHFSQIHLDKSYQYTHYSFPNLTPKKVNPIYSFFSGLYFWLLVVVTIGAFIMFLYYSYELVKSSHFLFN